MSTLASSERQTTSVKTHAGDFVWYELRTTDAKAAEEFYTHVVGWKAQPFGDSSEMPYTLLSVGNQTVAGLMQMPPQMADSGMKPHWAGFIGVPDVDAYTETVKTAGGRLLHGPQDIPGVGRFAAVADPQGAAFLLFKGSRDEAPPSLPMGTPGVVSWNELSANEEASAWEFYSKVFGWNLDTTMDMGPNGTYRIFNNGGPQIGAMMTRDPKNAPVPFWLFYFAIENIDAAVSRIQEKGGQVVMGPHPVPGDSWIVLGLDPQGAIFAVVGPKKS